MPEYIVDNDLALKIEQLAKREPFESLTFNDALSRVVDELESLKQGKNIRESSSRTPLLSKLSEITMSHGAKKAPSPKPSQWLVKVPELKTKSGLGSWKAICDYLKIETAGDSARRRLKKWVETNRPDWPEVPDV